MANRITGLKNLYVAKLNVDGSYEAPIRLMGAKSVKTTNESSETAFYSDDTMDYYGTVLNAISLEIEMAYLTPEIEAMLTGKTINDVGGMVTGTGDQQATVAFMYEMSTLQKPIRRCLYEVILSKDESEASTKTDSIEEKTIKLVGKAKPRVDGSFDLIMDSNHIPSGKEEAFHKTFEAFFQDVVLPDGTVNGAARASKK